MGKLLNLCFLIILGIFALTGYRQYEKLKYQLSQLPNEQFITQFVLQATGANESKDQRSNKKYDKRISQKKSEKKLKQLFTQIDTNIQLWLSDSINITDYHLSQALSILSQRNKSCSIQKITFSQTNFNTIGLVIFKLKQIFQKYLLKHFYPAQIQQNNEVEIKIFDLRSWTNQQQLKKKIDNAIESMIYLKKYETQKLFWFQSMMGILKSQKIRIEQVEIYAYILLENNMKKNQFNRIRKYIEEYTSLKRNFTLRTCGFQANNWEKSGKKKTSKNKGYRQKLLK